MEKKKMLILKVMELIQMVIYIHSWRKYRSLRLKSGRDNEPLEHDDNSKKIN